MDRFSPDDLMAAALLVGFILFAVIVRVMIHVQERRADNARDTSLPPGSPSSGTPGTAWDAAIVRTDELIAAGKYADARESAQRALSLSQQLFGDDPTHRARSLFSLGRAHSAQGDHRAAERAFTEASGLFEEWGVERRDFAHALFEQGMSIDAQGRHQEAEALIQKATGILITPSDAGVCVDPQTIAALKGRAAQYWLKHGNLNRAEAFCRDALDHVKRPDWPSPQDTAFLTNQLATIYRGQSRFEEAEATYRQAIASAEQLPDSECHVLAACLTDLADLYAEQGRSGDALERLERARSLLETHFGPDHVQMAECLHSRGVVEFAEGDYHRAEQSFSRAIEIWQKNSGILAPTLGGALQNLAETYRALGREREAETCEQRAGEMQDVRQSREPGNPLPETQASDTESTAPPPTSDQQPVQPEDEHQESLSDHFRVKTDPSGTYELDIRKLRPESLPVLIENLKANRIWRIDFEGCYAFSLQSDELIDAIARCTSLKQLMLKDTTLGDVSLAELTRRLMNPHIEHLTIRNYGPEETTEEFVAALVEWIRSSERLRTLSFDHLTLDVPLDAFCAALAESRSLERLVLWYMKILRDEEKLRATVESCIKYTDGNFFFARR